MMGFTEDLLNCVVSDIEQNWERLRGNLSYFVERVRKSGLSVNDLDNYLTLHGDKCPECVNQVFATIVHEEFLSRKGGDK